MYSKNLFSTNFSNEFPNLKTKFLKKNIYFTNNNSTKKLDKIHYRASATRNKYSNMKNTKINFLPLIQSKQKTNNIIYNQTEYINNNNNNNNSQIKFIDKINRDKSSKNYKIKNENNFMSLIEQERKIIEEKQKKIEDNKKK